MTTKRQEEIIKKSIKIIATKGIQGLTIKNLSKEIGISEPAIYRHFESKTDIILAILDNFLTISRGINDSIKRLEEDALKKIELMFLRIMEIFEKEPETITVIFSEEIFKNEKIYIDKINEITEENIKAVSSILKEGQEKNEIRNDITAEQLSTIIIGALRFKIKRWDLTGNYSGLIDETKEFLAGLRVMIKK